MPLKSYFVSYNLPNHSFLRSFEYNISASSINEFKYGDIFDICLLESDFNPLINKSIIVNISNSSFSKVMVLNTSSDGSISLLADWGLGEYNISCLFKGDKYFNSSKF